MTDSSPKISPYAMLLCQGAGLVLLLYHIPSEPAGPTQAQPLCWLPLLRSLLLFLTLELSPVPQHSDRFEISGCCC